MLLKPLPSTMARRGLNLLVRRRNEEAVFGLTLRLILGGFILSGRRGCCPCFINPMSVELSNEEISRYSRHLILPDVGMAGQKKLKATSVLCIGTGGLGSPISMYLAAAGIGKIGIVDFDVVDFSEI